MHTQYFFTQDEGNIILSCIWIKRTINLNNNTYWRYVEVYISAWLNLHIIAIKCLQIDKQMHEQMWTFKHWGNTSKQEYECICTWKKRSRYMYAHKHLCAHTHKIYAYLHSGHDIWVCWYASCNLTHDYAQGENVSLHDEWKFRSFSLKLEILPTTIFF